MALVKKIVRKFTNAYRREILRDEPLLEAKRWFRDHGDTAHRLNYDLNADSIVIDLGGYVGDFAYEINHRFGATVHLFEPVPKFHALCTRRFADNPKVHSHCYGLGSAAGRFPISDSDDASSFHVATGSGAIEAEVRPIVETLAELGIDHIDLLKLNIEGGEYDVLASLIAHDWIRKIGNIQVQFHTVGDTYEADRDAMRAAFAKTHRETWCYKFVWENWTRI